MPKMIQLRHVPDALHRRLTTRAAMSGMTLSDYLKQELEGLAAQLTPAELNSRLTSLSRTVLSEQPAEAIRAERGAR